MKYIAQLIEQRFAGEKFDLAFECQGDQFARRALPQRRRHDDVRIDDDTHSDSRVSAGALSLLACLTNRVHFCLNRPQRHRFAAGA